VDPVSTVDRVLLIRHGATGWSSARRHTGRTDVPLNAHGQAQASALAPAMAAVAAAGPVVVLASPLQRAWRTAELAGLVPFELDDDLVEWDYGAYEGLTTPQIREQAPGWTVFTQPCPGGETAEQVTERCDRFLDRIGSIGSGSTAVVVAHSHLLRSLAARWLGRPVADGGMLELGVGSTSVLGFEHGVATLRHWNLANALAVDPLG
jgi:broad specificity phosphatase PhoE